jgi:hypothetical protein
MTGIYGMTYRSLNTSRQEAFFIDQSKKDEGLFKVPILPAKLYKDKKG